MVLLVTTVKNEGPNILEWVAYHRHIGFRTIHVYQNDSDDETEKSLRTLDRIGAIRYFPNKCRRGQWQNKAYRRSSFHPDYDAHKWCLALDGDEFLNVKIGSGRVQDLASAFDHAAEIRINWRNFGSGYHRDLSDDLVIERYTRADPAERIGTVWQGYKTLFRTDSYQRPGIHSPSAPLRDDVIRVNGSGLNWDTIPSPSWRSVDPGLRAIAQINHYPLRDLASFLIKRDRGSASHVDRDVGVRYWSKFEHNDAEDLTIQRQIDGTKAEMARLNDLAGRDRLFMLKRRSLELWQEKYAQLSARADMQQLRNRISEDFKRAA